MRYSVILPVYNGGEYVKECVKSILAQTYTEFNFIVLDNCSTDGTAEWIDALEDDRVILIRSLRLLTIEENWGRIKTLEKNELITLIGHDDILYPDFLQSINYLVNKFPNAGLYHTHFNFINSKGYTIRQSKAMKNIYSDGEFLAAFLLGNIDSMGTGYVMRAKDYDLIGGIPTKYPNLLFADFELWINLIREKFIAVGATNSFAFRLHQSTTQKSKDAQMHRAFELFIDFLASLRETSAKMGLIVEAHSNTFLHVYCKSYAHRLLRSSLKDRNNISIADFVTRSKLWASKLGISKSYFPEKDVSIILSLLIDRSSFLRKIFMALKSIKK